MKKSPERSVMALVAGALVANALAVVPGVIGVAVAESPPAEPAPAAKPAPETQPAPPAEPTPPGVTQIIPRGRLAAVFHPEFVPAGEAALPDSAWILGVAVDGEAHAYSLNLLNHHEVVNDNIGGRPIAAVW